MVSKSPTTNTENESGNSIGTWVDTWLQATKRKGRDDKTIARYNREFRRYIVWLEENERPSTPKELSGVSGGHHLEDFFDALRGEGKAESTLGLYYQTVRTFFKWCIKRSASDDPDKTLPPHVLRSPTDFVDAPSNAPAASTSTAFTEQEYKRLLAAAGDPRTNNVWRRRNRVLVLLLNHTGLRRAEIAGLEIGDYALDTDTGEWSIQVRNGVAKRTKRDDDARIVGVFNSVKEEVDLYIRQLEDHGHTSGALFPSERRDDDDNVVAVSPAGINHIIRSLARGLQDACPNRANHPKPPEPPKPVKRSDPTGCEAGCIRWTDVHRWRHTWATDALMRGIDPGVVMDAGGWENIEMLKRYVRASRQKISLKAFAKAENGH